MAAEEPAQHQGNDQHCPGLDQAGRNLFAAQPLSENQQRIQVHHGRQGRPFMPGRKTEAHSEQKQGQKACLDYPLPHQTVLLLQGVTLDFRDPGSSPGLLSA
jgi:hypothetical protein